MSAIAPKPGLAMPTPRSRSGSPTAQTEKDPDKRKAIYAQVQQQLLADSVSVFLGYPKRALAAAKKVQGLVLSPIGNIVLRDVGVSG